MRADDIDRTELLEPGAGGADAVERALAGALSKRGGGGSVGRGRAYCPGARGETRDVRERRSAQR